MKVFTLALVLFASHCALGQVWTEVFDEGDGSTSGTGSPSGGWASTCVGCSSPAGGNTTSVFEVNNGNFRAGRVQVFGGGSNGMDAEGVWTSPSISIVGYTDVSIFIETATAFTESGDYLNVYYQLDVGSGFGAETLFHTQTTSTLATSTGISPTLNGVNVRIVVRAFTDNKNDIFTFDNIAVTNTLFSAVASGNYGTAGSWSSLGIDQAVCGTCVPNNYTRVVIGGNDVITIAAAAQASSVTINGTGDALGAGTLTYSGNFDLDIDLAGSLTINSGGQITSGGNLSSAITFTDDEDHSIINNGSINVGDITITSTLLDDGSTITLTGSGTTLLTDALQITGSVFGASSLINSSTGDFTVTGTTTLSNGEFTDTDNTSITTFIGNVTQSGFQSAFNTTAVTTSTNLVFRGGINNDAGTFTAGGATFDTNSQSITGDTDISFANFVNISGVTVTNNNTGEVSFTRVAGGVTLTGSGTWTQGTNSTLNYTGTSIGVTGFNASASGNTVNYNSTTSSQQIMVPGTTYAILTLDNTSGIALTVGGNITVTATLNMTSGIVDLGGNTFTLGSGAGADLNRTASTTTNWMYGGSFSRYWPAGSISSTAGNLYGLFPMGTSAASSYRPFQATSTANTTGAGTVTMTHTDAATVTDLSPTYNDGGTAIVRKHNAQFVLANAAVTGGTFNVSATMTGLVAGTLSNIRLALSNGATTVTAFGTHQAATGSAPNPTASRTGIALANLFGDYRITTTNSVATPLPIDLLSFTASWVDSQVQLNWSTASEHNNDFFTVERTYNLEQFEKVVTVKGNGTTKAKTSYTAVDDAPLPGKSYYRLKQTDFDGKVSFSEVREIFNDLPTQIYLYPNPVTQGAVTFELRGGKPLTQLPITIHDITGRSVYSSNFGLDNTGFIKTSIELPQIPAGIYIFVVDTPLGQKKKLVVR